LGYDVTTLSDSIEALEMFSAEPDRFDIIVTDMTMPNLTGVELGRRILAIRPDIPIIMCTGFSEKMSREKAGDIGIKEYLMKPVDKTVMANALRRYLD
jgi:CheY-like chemotaxis protein